MRKGIIIELTALLDVILILFFLVLVNGTKKAELAQKNASIAAADAARLEQTLQHSLKSVEGERLALNTALRGVALLEESCRLVSVTVRQAGETRWIAVGAEDGQSREVRLDWGEEQYAKNALAAALKEALTLYRQEQLALIAFQYDRGEIYQSDYELVMGVLRENAQQNVYLAEYDYTKSK